MSYDRGGGSTPMPGMELGMAMPAQPIYPGVRIGGSDMPGAFTLQVLHPNGQTINVEIGDLSRPLSAASSHGAYIASASGPVREGLSRPTSDHMRRRASSVASTSGMEYDSFGGGGNHHHMHHNGYQGGGPSNYRNFPHKPLIDRVGAMNLNDRMSNNSSPMPDLTRSDPSSSFNSGRGGFGGGDSFSRPASRMSNRSYNQPPYARPNSSNSFRSNGSFQSNGFRPRGRDGFYPKYNPDSKTNIGSYPVLPVQRRRPFFTPVPEDPVAAILVKNVAADCTLADINSTFSDFGRIKTVELIDRCPPTMAVYVEYESKDDADMAIQQTNGVMADKFVLETTHVDPKIVHRPHKTSNDPALRLAPETGLVAPVKAARTATTNGADVDGGRTPLASMFASKSPTPHPTTSSSSGPANTTRRDGANGTGWGDPTSTTAKTSGTGWDDPEPTTQRTDSDDGWGMPASKTAEEGNGWRGPTVREESSDIDLV